MVQDSCWKCTEAWEIFLLIYSSSWLFVPAAPQIQQVWIKVNPHLFLYQEHHLIQVETNNLLVFLIIVKIPIGEQPVYLHSFLECLRVPSHISTVFPSSLTLFMQKFSEIFPLAL